MRSLMISAMGIALVRNRGASHVVLVGVSACVCICEMGCLKVERRGGEGGTAVLHLEEEQCLLSECRQHEKLSLCTTCRQRKIIVSSFTMRQHEPLVFGW